MKSIRNILLLGLSAIAVLFVVQALLLRWGEQNIQRDVVETARKNTLASSQLSELAVLAQQIRRYEKEYFVYVTNTERRENYVKEWSGANDKIAKLLQNMRTNAQQAFTADEMGKITNWASAADFYSAEMRKVFGTVNDRQAQIAVPAAPPVAVSTASKAASKDAVPSIAPAAVAMFSPVEVNSMITAGKDRLSGVLIKGVAEMYDSKTKATLALGDIASSSFGRLWNMVAGTVALGLALAAFLAWRLPAAVTSPLSTLTTAVENMSKGDLEKTIDVGGVTEFQGLSTALERMRLAQKTLVQRMRASRPAA
jgi:HAMP domain-containing protein